MDKRKKCRGESSPLGLDLVSRAYSETMYDRDVEGQDTVSITRAQYR
jgi:hypothetical protein